jgi:2-polyprenyl-3-methyl-5-hydroxy-6-metoxy-1,4-benzoquinol methylase
MNENTMQSMWDGRYRERDAMWGSEPNRFLVEAVADLDRGTALDLGCGHGRNALWLAERGFTVTGLDLSPVAIEQADALAAETGVAVEFEAVDLLTWTPNDRLWDLVVLAYLHLPETMRQSVHAAAVSGVAPGGRIVVIAHHLDNLDRGTGGPPNPDWLFTEQQLASDFADLDIVRNEQVVRPTEQGDALDLLCVAVKR